MTADEVVEGAELHLYVLEIVGRGVKVGVSGKPYSRLKNLRREAAGYGFDAGRVWISVPHVEARANERQVMALAGPRNRREYLAVDFDIAVGAAERLAKTRVDRAAIEAKREATFQMFKAGCLGGWK
jgi:hypothetical protein